MAEPQITELSLTSITDSDVSSRLATYERVLGDLGIGVEAGYGFFRDYVLRLHAALLAAAASEFTKTSYAVNPLAAPFGSDVDTGVLDAVATDYGLQRIPAGRSSGVLRVVVTANQGLVIPQGSQFLSPSGVVYVTSSPYVVRTGQSAAANNNELLLVAVPTEGAYEFYLPVVSQLAGVIPPPPVGARFSNLTAAITRLSRIEAATGFSAGKAVESNDELISRMRRSLSAKSFASRNSIEALLIDQDRFPTIQHVSTVGYGDSELVRAASLGTQGNGVVDVFVKHAGFPAVVKVAVVATASQVNPDDLTRMRWVCTIPREQAAGGCWVESVSSPTLANIRGVVSVPSPSPADSRPVITSNDFDLSFSSFQAINVTLEADRADGNVGDTADVVVNLVAVGVVAEAQALADDRQFKLIGSDVLIRAAIPAAASVLVTVRQNGAAVLPDQTPIRLAVADYINAAPIGAILHTSRIATIVNNQLPSGVDVTDVSVLLEVMLPDGVVHRRRLTGDVTPPTVAELGVTPRTVAMYCRDDNVRIELTPDS